MLTTFEHEPSSWLQASSIINNNRRHPLVPHQWTSLKQLLYHTTLVAHDKDLEDFLSTAACKKRHYVGNNYGVSPSCRGHVLPWCETSRKLELLDPQATSLWRGKVTLRSRFINQKASQSTVQSNRKAIRKSANATQARICMRRIQDHWRRYILPAHQRSSGTNGNNTTVQPR